MLPIKEIAELHSVDIKHEEMMLPDNTTEQTDVLVKCDLYKPEGEVTMAMSYSSLCPVKKEQPKSLYSLLPPACCTTQHAHETSQVRSQDSLKTTTVHSVPPDEAGIQLKACVYIVFTLLLSFH
ncbi:hypothetical protein NQD34_003171 [Periophthalmus magnuspinnatus]|nr:hypothetical protein NQD34_003171 [Periophthalmus magnuspinnatus]